MLSYILSILGLAGCISASLIKGKRMKIILLLVCLGNALVATSYLLDGGINGAISGYIGATQTLVNALFERKQKKVPIWLLCIYAAMFIGCNLAVEISALSLLAILPTLFFVLSIGQENGARYRVCIVFNSVLWCTYDICSGSYSGLLAHVSIFLFTVAGMIIHDRKEKLNAKSDV